MTKDIPWGSMGVETVASRLGKSIVPIGTLPFQPKDWKDGVPPEIAWRSHEPNAEKYLMNIKGTAIQAGKDKLVTCGHVVQEILDQRADGYILAQFTKGSVTSYVPYAIRGALRYRDPRTNAPNPAVDLAVLLVTARSVEEIPYETPIVRWGDSSSVGIGDPVVVCGFPYGEQMFLMTKANRGIVQPTFYSGIVSAILPVVKPDETRILQLSIPVAGGMSGGAVFKPDTGEVIGMITSCWHLRVPGAPDEDDDIQIPQPMSYALPSEIIAPYVEVIDIKYSD